MGVKDNFIYEKCMDALDATYGKKKMRDKISKLFTRFWNGLITNMKKEAQTYKEEREQQKRESRKVRQREKS